MRKILTNKIRGAVILLLLMFFAGNGYVFAREKVLLGIDVLAKQNFAPLKGKKIGLITNHTGRNGKGKSTIDLLFNAEGVQLVALFSPEHGIRGNEEHGKSISDFRDAKTGLPVYSLYGKTTRPTEAMLEGLDALVFDIQDIGTRFYTYITTLAYALEEAAKKDIEIFVLDRPNPITGAIVEGEPLAAGVKHFTAYVRVPVRHGMTIGEIANWHNKTANLNARLQVIRMENWSRGMWWDETGLRFYPTSPNIRKLISALLYPGIGGLEATNVAVGRGTKQPFEIFGAPWMEAEVVAERLAFSRPRGFEFKAVRFTPKKDLYEGQLCKGVEIVVTDRNEARLCELFIHIVTILLDLYPKQFVVRWDEMERVTGSREFEQMIRKGYSAETMIFLTREKADAFLETRKPYLLYE